MRGSVYLAVRDFDRLASFYEKALDMKVSTLNDRRSAMFKCKNLNRCLMNGYYDDVVMHNNV